MSCTFVSYILYKMLVRVTNILFKMSQVPRVALKETTLGGLLKQPAIPGHTVFFFPTGPAAEQSGSLYYTFGSGVELRSCPFLPFWKSLMTDVRASLLKK